MFRDTRGDLSICAAVIDWNAGKTFIPVLLHISLFALCSFSRFSFNDYVLPDLKINLRIAISRTE